MTWVVVWNAPACLPPPSQPTHTISRAVPTQHAGVGYVGLTRQSGAVLFAVQAAGKCPEYDVLVTNPPFSSDHIERCLQFAVRSKKPWLILIPQYVAKKPHYMEMLRRLRLGHGPSSHPAGAGANTQVKPAPFYLGPTVSPYAFAAPRRADVVRARGVPAFVGCSTEVVTEPGVPPSSEPREHVTQRGPAIAVPAGSFQCVWFVGLGSAHQQAVYDDCRADCGAAPGCQLAHSVEDLPQLMAAPKLTPAERRWRKKHGKPDKPTATGSSQGAGVGNGGGNHARAPHLCGTAQEGGKVGAKHPGTYRRVFNEATGRTILVGGGDGRKSNQNVPTASERKGGGSTARRKGGGSRVTSKKADWEQADEVVTLSGLPTAQPPTSADDTKRQAGPVKKITTATVSVDDTKRQAGPVKKITTATVSVDDTNRQAGPVKKITTATVSVDDTKRQAGSVKKIPTATISPSPRLPTATVSVAVAARGKQKNKKRKRKRGRGQSCAQSVTRHRPGHHRLTETAPRYSLSS